MIWLTAIGDGVTGLCGVRIKNEYPRWTRVGTRPPDKQTQGAVRFQRQHWIAQVPLPAIPNRLGNRKNTASASVMLTELELEHHLVEGPLKYVGDIRTFHALREPFAFIGVHRCRESILMQSENVLQIANCMLIGSVEIGGLYLQNAKAAYLRTIEGVVRISIIVTSKANSGDCAVAGMESSPPILIEIRENRLACCEPL